MKDIWVIHKNFKINFLLSIIYVVWDLCVSYMGSFLSYKL